jgi:hypothetical protein
MFERAFQKSHESALELELTSFINNLTEKVKESTIGVWRKNQVHVMATPTKVKETSKKELPNAETFAPISLPVVQAPEGTKLLNVKASLFIFSIQSNCFVPYIESVHAEIIQTSRYEYSICVIKEGSPVISQNIEPRMNMYIDYFHLSFIWVWYDLETKSPSISWCLKFEQH